MNLQFQKPRLSLIFLGACAFLGSACSLGFESGASTESAKNSCESSDDCGAGSCAAGICQTKSTELTSLLLDVTPPAGTPQIAGVAFTSVVDEFELGPNGYQITLGHVSRLAGHVLGQEIQAENCVADAQLDEGLKTSDGSLAARLTLTPRARLLGLPNPSHTVDVSELGLDSYALQLVVPPGRYDVYVEPKQSDSGCVRPPYLVVDQEIASGNINFDVQLPEPEALSVVVRYPGDANDLEGWLIDIVERRTGRLLSNRARLPAGKKSGDNWEYSAQVAFSQVEGDDAAPATELVRLSPPENVIGPTIYVERSVVDLFQDGEGLVDQLKEQMVPVSFSSKVSTDNATLAVPSNVTLLALALDSTGPGTIASFSTSVATDETGSFEVQLLPGRYRVRAQPWDERLSPRELEMVVSDAPQQTGKTIEVVKRNTISGRLVDFSGKSLPGVPVTASSSDISRVSTIIEIGQGKQVFPPAATAVASADDGRFTFLADHGTFHFTARPQAGSGYAWGVQLGMQVDAEPVDLGRTRLPLPVSISGSLISQDLGDVVPEALIVAYAFLKEGQLAVSREDADQVIPVGEARVDSEGRFRLLLPSSFK